MDKDNKTNEHKNNEMNEHKNNEINEHKNNEINELMLISRNMLAGINGLGEQMGVVNSRLGRLETKTSNIEDRMNKYEDELRVTRPQADSIRRAIHQRINKLLDIRYEDGVVVSECIRDDKLYKPGFISKCYSDSRKYSDLGTPYYETLRKDYVGVLDYINGWAPEVGVSGYRIYLDERRRIKASKEG